MAPRQIIAAALSVIPLAAAQMIGTAETHLPLTTWACTTSGGCVQQTTSVVLDWNYHFIHQKGTSVSCTTSNGVNTTLCPNEATCAQNCVIDGANYANSGIATSADVLTLHQYVQSSSGTWSNASPRVYLLGPNNDYVMIKLLNQEFSFDVDVSTLVCGENGALYLSQMDATGGRTSNNPGGAQYGSGYCDAQCPVQTWINGTLNTNNAGYCCDEMDLWEANSEANAFTPHPCLNNNCDKGGCGFNPYANGNQNYYGPGLTVDTTKPFTVTTQFITTDGTASGSLNEIRRHYVQNGVVIPNAVSSSGASSILASACGSASSFGGLAQMGQALGAGMVLVFSIWNDNGQFMNWLDSGSSGPCSSTAGNPATIMANNPGTFVKFSNIRWGDIGSTSPNTGGGTTTSSRTTTTTRSTSSRSTGTTTTRTTTTTTGTGAGPTQTHWGQCGGIGYGGPTACASPYTCTQLNPYYSQCL